MNLENEELRNAWRATIADPQLFATFYNTKYLKSDASCLTEDEVKQVIQFAVDNEMLTADKCHPATDNNACWYIIPYLSNSLFPTHRYKRILYANEDEDAALDSKFAELMAAVSPPFGPNIPPRVAMNKSAAPGYWEYKILLYSAPGEARIFGPAWFIN